MRITFFKTPRPKEFNYIPRYYDEQKEAAEERQKRIEQELGIHNQNAYRPNISRGSMARKFAEKRSSNRKSSFRLIIIIAILSLLAYYILNNNFSFTFLPK
ncbi:MAG: hypothetical protein JXA77_12800 [Bacteroidales bacterium]|nr:hypothetical protein [Bacteroidales bacterium]MBN2820471.1 hypothetical protein [Bacteroidales bacterium]